MAVRAAGAARLPRQGMQPVLCSIHMDTALVRIVSPEFQLRAVIGARFRYPYFFSLHIGVAIAVPLARPRRTRPVVGVRLDENGLSSGRFGGQEHVFPLPRVPYFV